MGGFSANLSAAKQAVAYVAKKMTIGANNDRPYSSPETREAALCVPYERSIGVSGDFIEHAAREATKYGCGNCGEQAAIAFVYLKDRGVLPLDYMHLMNAGGSRIHAFVVIGRPEGSSDRDIDSWGREAVVVCDPWDHRQAYAAYEIGTKMSLFRPAATWNCSGARGRCKAAADFPHPSRGPPRFPGLLTRSPSFRPLPFLPCRPCRELSGAAPV